MHQNEIWTGREFSFLLQQEMNTVEGEQGKNWQTTDRQVLKKATLKSRTVKEINCYKAIHAYVISRQSSCTMI